MKAIGFNQPLPISDPQSLVDLDLPDAEYGEQDLLVDVLAIAVNPADTKVRASAQPAPGTWRIPGWDAVGRVRAVGARVTGFKPGDRVFYAGAIDRPGCYAERQAVDARIAAHAPATLTDEDAAALPLTALTAWETLFDRLMVGQHVPGAANAIVVIGGGWRRRVHDHPTGARPDRPERHRHCLTPRNCGMGQDIGCASCH